MAKRDRDIHFLASQDGGTDTISFSLGFDAGAAAAAGRNPLAPNRNFLLTVQCL